jgi:hypothetical protein
MEPALWPVFVATTLAKRLTPSSGFNQPHMADFVAKVFWVVRFSTFATKSALFGRSCSS